MDQNSDSPSAGQSACSGPTVMYISRGREDEMKIVGYCKDPVREVVVWVCTILTVGILRLVFYWRPDWMLKCTCVVESLDKAEYVLLEDQYCQKFVETVKQQTNDYNSVNTSLDHSQHSELILSVRDCEQPGGGADVQDSASPLLKVGQFSRRYFVNKKMKFVWNNRLCQFQKLSGLDEGLPCSYFHETTGLTETQRIERRGLYGDNTIAVHVTPVIKLLFSQALNPFYIFQLFSCALWFGDEYYYYASCIIVVSCLSLTVQIYQTRSMQRALKSTIMPSEAVTVYHADTGGGQSVIKAECQLSSLPNCSQINWSV